MGHVILLAGSWGFQNGFPAMRLKFQRADFFATRDQPGEEPRRRSSRRASHQNRNTDRSHKCSLSWRLAPLTLQLPCNVELTRGIPAAGATCMGDLSCACTTQLDCMPEIGAPADTIRQRWSDFILDGQQSAGFTQSLKRCRPKVLIRTMDQRRLC
jgi:hypothetical protein